MILQSIDVAWLSFDRLLEDYIKTRPNITVLEIGGGANPCLTEAQVKDYHIDFTVMDISATELKKSQKTYFKKEIGDLSEKPLNQKFDLIFSKMLMEHVQNPESLHTNVLKMLNPDAKVVHFFATKFGLPSMLNLILPDTISDYIVYKLQGRDPHQNGKFKAFYKDCYGPTQKSIKKYISFGYNIEEYYGFLGHDYLCNYRLLGSFEQLWNKIIQALNSPLFCSNAIVILKNKVSKY